VGTSVVTGSGEPAAGMVYKLVAHKNDLQQWTNVAKTSTAKLSVGGRKTAFRRLDAAGIAREEIVQVGDETGRPASPAGLSGLERELLVPLVQSGIVDERYVGVSGTRRARQHQAAVMQELPIEAFRLGRGDAVIPTSYR